MPRHSKASRRSKEQRKRVQGRRFAAESGDRLSLVLDSLDKSDEDYEPSSEVPEQYRLSTERPEILYMVMMTMMMMIMMT